MPDPTPMNREKAYELAAWIDAQVARGNVAALKENAEHMRGPLGGLTIVSREAAAGLRQLADDRDNIEKELNAMCANFDAVRAELAALRERYDAACEQVTAAVNRERALREEREREERLLRAELTLSMNVAYGFRWKRIRYDGSHEFFMDPDRAEAARLAEAKIENA